MQRAHDIPEVTVSETGAAIPLEVLREAGIRPGDRVALVLTTRGSLLVVPTMPRAGAPSLRAVTGICPRPDQTPPEADRTFLHEIRYGDDR